MAHLTYHDGQEIRPASLDEPFPVQTSAVTSTIIVRRELKKFGPSTIPGIAPADAFDANDQMGTVLTFEGVPRKGTITEMIFYDLDDEGINKMVYVFSENPTPSIAASDAAFSVGDQMILNLIGVFSFTTWRDNAVSQIGFTANTPCDYVMDGTNFYIAVQTLGADNIASGSMPQISMVIEVAA